jgi:YVTN family beta-propeller protein
VLHALSLPGTPADVVASPDGRTVYATIPGAVLAIDAAAFRTPVRIATLPAAAPPHGLALTDDGTKLYVGMEPSGPAKLTEVDLPSKRTHTIDLGLAGGRSFGIQLGTNYLYYPFGQQNTVLVLDTENDQKIGTIPVNGGPADVGFAPSGDVWIQDDGNGSVAILDSMSNKVVATVPTRATGSGHIAVSPSGAYAASTRADSQSVVIFNARTHRVTGTVRTGKGPATPIFSADSTKLFVLSSGAGEIAVIDTTTLAITAHWKVGTDPVAGALRFTAKR